MKFTFVLFVVLINFSVFSQNSKLLITLNPSDCGNCIRRVNSFKKQISNDMPTYWLMEESYKEQIKKLEEKLVVEISSSVIFSDSLFSQLSTQGSVFAVYKKDSLVLSFPISKMDIEHVGIINSMIDKPTENTIFQLPDSLMFSKRVTLKKQKSDYLLVDDLYNELTLLSDSKVKQIKGESFFTKEIYYNAFKDNSYYDSLFLQIPALQKMSYNEVKFVDAAFGDSTIEVFCNLPVLKRIQNNMGVALSPAIITLSKDLTFIKIQSLSDYSVLQHKRAKYYLTPIFFEYYNQKFYFSYMPDNRKKFDKKVYSFASLAVNQKEGLPKMDFLNITFSREWATTLSTFRNRYIYFKLPAIYNSLLPFEYNLENSTATNYGISEFSFNELVKSTKGEYSYSDLFSINAIYRGDKFLVVLFRKNNKTIKDIYDIIDHKLIYHYEYENPLVNPKDGTNTFYLPVDWNKFVFLDGKNRIKEVTF